MNVARTWIVVADGAKARLFENCGPGKGMAPLSDGEIQGNHSATREIGSDRPGRVHDRLGPGRHAMAPRVDWHEQQKQDFLKALAARLDRAAAQKAFDRLILVAPAKALGELRAALGQAAAGQVAGELPKDLTKVPAQDLPRHLDDLIAL